MAATYSGDPSASPLDEVRFLLGDTDTTAPLLQDNEIAYFLLTLAPRQAALAACRVLARTYARTPGSKTIGDVTISYADLSTRFAALAKDMLAENTSFAIPLPYLSGGVTTADPLAFNDEDDQWQNNNPTSGYLPAPDLTQR